MKTINVVDATPIQLDWLVAKCEGLNVHIPAFAENPWVQVIHPDGAKSLCPKWSSDWSQGGALIEREGINLSVDYQDDAMSNDMIQIGWKGNLWNNSVPGTAGFLQWAYGPTPLVAAMRCLCASKLGDTVEIPEELL